MKTIRIAGDAARFAQWRLPLAQMQTPYIFPSENGLRCFTRRVELADWHISGDFHFSVGPYSTAQLTRATHRHLLQPEPGVWLNLDCRHMGVGGDDSWSPSVHQKYLLDLGEYHYTLCWRRDSAPQSAAATTGG